MRRPCAASCGSVRTTTCLSTPSRPCFPFPTRPGSAADTHTRYLLPLIKREDGTEQQQYRNGTQGINRHLKQLSEYLHLSSPLTLYVARHSWASIAQATHIPIHVISGAMGHDSEVTTQIYLASIQTSQIDEANKMIIDSI